MTSSADVDSLDGIVVALYASISFPPHGAPDWVRFRGLFDPAASMIRVDPRATPAMLTSSVADYIQRLQAMIDAGSLAAFEERELVRRTEVFGDLAQVFSSYERCADGSQAVRGVNSMHLVKDGMRWWITAVAWTDETHDNPLPARFLPRSST